MEFRARALLRSSRLALSPQRIFIQFMGLSIAFVVYYLFAVVSLFAGGLNFQEVMSYGFVPSIFSSGNEVGGLSKTVFVFGCFLTGSVLLIANTAVCRSVFMSLTQHHVYTWREACRFALTKARAVLLTPIAIGLLGFTLVLGAWLIGLLGRIPIMGELGIALFTIVWLFAALLLIFFGVVGCVSLIQAPATLAVSDEDAFESIFECFSTVWRQLPRFLFYQSVVTLLTFFGFFAAAFLAKRSFLVMSYLFPVTMGEKYNALISRSESLVQSWLSELEPLIAAVFGQWRSLVYFTNDVSPVDTSLSLDISAVVIAASFVFVGGLVVAYTLATFNSGSIIVHLLLQQKKRSAGFAENSQPKGVVAERKDRLPQRQNQEQKPPLKQTSTFEVDTQ